MNWGIKCNIAAPHRFLRLGSLCWIVDINYGGGSDRIYIEGLTRSGRKTKTWIDKKYVKNCRPAWNISGIFEEKSCAQRYADFLNKSEIKPA